MTGDSSVLDAAYERLAVFGFDDPNGFVNHAPMGCEALDALGRPDDVDRWSRTPDAGTPAVAPVRPERFAWQDALGDLRRTAEWLGFFDRAVAGDAPELDPAVLADAAVASGDVHAVKLVEACRRGTAATGDPAFAAAAERVVRRTLRGR